MWNPLLMMEPITKNDSLVSLPSKTRKKRKGGEKKRCSKMHNCVALLKPKTSPRHHSDSPQTWLVGRQEQKRSDVPTAHSHDFLRASPLPFSAEKPWRRGKCNNNDAVERGRGSLDQTEGEADAIGNRDARFVALQAGKPTNPFRLAAR